jgi:zinc protease
VGLLLRNEGGFIAEQRPGERGLAHLIEHIALLSPTSNAPDDLYHFLHVGLPLTFPAPSAGTTSWRETNYFLSTRTTHAADIDNLLGLFRDVVGDLTFRSDAVDEARAQVIQEMAGRKPGNDIYASYIAAVAPGSPTDVIDAQNSDDVPTASIATIRALYHRLYRPETMMIVMVGNIDAVQMKALVRQRFGAWQGGGPEPVRPAIPTFHADRIAPISYSEMPQGRRGVSMTVVTALPPTPPVRRLQTKAALMDMLAMRAVNNRLARVQPGGPPGKVGVFIENGEQGHRLIMLWDNFTADQWRPAIAGLRKTSCDLGTVGFSDLEWTTAKQNVIADLDQRARGMADVTNVELAKDLSHALADGRDLIAPDELLRHAKSWFPTISTQAGNHWWHHQWHAGLEHIRVESPELADVKDPESAIRTTADTAVENPRCKVRH